MQRKTLVQVLFASVLFSISCLCFGQDFRVELRSEPDLTELEASHETGRP